MKYLRRPCPTPAVGHALTRSLLLSAAIASSVDGQSIVAHRGASFDAPENTLAAFQLAWEQGADAIEGDFHLTADDEIVCIHDRDTTRTSGESLTVAQASLEDLRALDVGAWKSPRFKGERIPTLSEVLAVVPEGKVVLIEIKCGTEIFPALERVLLSTELASEQLRVISFDSQVIATCKQRLPGVRAYWLTDHAFDDASGRWTNPIEEVLPILESVRADGLDSSVPAEVVDAAFVRRLRTAGLEFHAWTVDDPVAATRLHWLGVDSITTNRPAFLRSVLPQRDLRPHLVLRLALDGDLHGSIDSRIRIQREQPQGRGEEPTWRAGVYGLALDLGAGTESVTIERQLPDRGTLALWYRPHEWYDYQTVFDTPNDANGWELWIYGTGLLRFRAHPAGAVLSHALHPTGDAQEWHHLALSWDRSDESGRALCLYVNGHLADETAWSDHGWFPSGPSFSLGGGHAGNTKGKGAFDEVLLFDVPLLPEEVRAVMRTELITP